MTNNFAASLRAPAARLGAIAAVLLWAWAMCLPAFGADLVRDSYYWYAPEHEKYSRTQFFSEPSFNAPLVRITRTQRFRLVGGSRGWALLEFDGGVKAFIHMRLLRLMLHDPAATDPWYEFQRASVFPEEPAKIEARLKGPDTDPAPASSARTPVWKRYKDSWGIGKARAPSLDVDADATTTGTRPPEKKARKKYPLLPPIGSDPADKAETAAGSETGSDAERSGGR